MIGQRNNERPKLYSAVLVISPFGSFSVVAILLRMIASRVAIAATRATGHLSRLQSQRSFATQRLLQPTRFQRRVLGGRPLIPAMTQQGT